MKLAAGAHDPRVERGVVRREKVGAVEECGDLRPDPPGTSKWNKIEHKLFSRITQNWRGQPLVNHEVVVGLIAATTSKTGLKVRAELDRNLYPTGLKVPDEDMAALAIDRAGFHGEWNYTLAPRTQLSNVVTSDDDVRRLS